jgi:hypothetical protein
MHIVMIASNQSSFEVFENIKDIFLLLDPHIENITDPNKYLWFQHNCIERHISFVQT